MPVFLLLSYALATKQNCLEVAQEDCDGYVTSFSDTCYYNGNNCDSKCKSVGNTAPWKCWHLGPSCVPVSTGNTEGCKVTDRCEGIHVVGSHNPWGAQHGDPCPPIDLSTPCYYDSIQGHCVPEKQDKVPSSRRHAKQPIVSNSTRHTSNNGLAKSNASVTNRTALTLTDHEGSLITPSTVEQQGSLRGHPHIPQRVVNSSDDSSDSSLEIPTRPIRTDPVPTTSSTADMEMLIFPEGAPTRPPPQLLTTDISRAIPTRLAERYGAPTLPAPIQSSSNSETEVQDTSEAGSELVGSDMKQFPLLSPEAVAKADSASSVVSARNIWVIGLLYLLL